MKKCWFSYICLVLSICCVIGSTQAQSDFNFQQKLQYNINCNLSNDTLYAEEEISYQNLSPTKIDTLFFNLWANAFATKTSPFSEQLLRLRNKDFYFSKDDALGGYLNIEEATHQIQYLNNDLEMAFIALTKPLQTNQTIKLHINYTLKLPRLIDRIGYTDSLIYLTHWYPQIAVYDDLGWHQMHYLSMGEFYNEYADYEVKIKILNGYKLASSGNIVNMDSTSATYQISKENVEDLPIFIGNRKVKDQQMNINGQNINIRVFSNDNKLWENAHELVKRIIGFYSKYMSSFPYKDITIVQGNRPARSGMEYPGIVVINSYNDEEELAYYLAHELAHQYFYAALGSNERKEPFMDEGLTTWLERKYTFDSYKKEYYTNKIPNFLKSTDSIPILNKIALFQNQRHFGQAINTPSEELSVINYGLNSYPYAAHMWKGLEQYLGEENWKTILQSFYKKYQNKHINAQLFRQHVENHTSKDLTWFFDGILKGEKVSLAIENIDCDKTNCKITLSSAGLVAPFQVAFYKNGSMVQEQWIDGFFGNQTLEFNKEVDFVAIDPSYCTNDEVRENNQMRVSGILRKTEKLKIHIPFGLNDYNRTNLHLCPLVTYNYNDKLMLGAAIFNSTLPAKNTKFLIAPQYSLSQKSMQGQAWFKHSLYLNEQTFRKIEFNLGLQSYHYFTNDVIGYRLRYTKIDPSVIFHFRQDALSTIYQKISFKLIHLREDIANFIQSPRLPTIDVETNNVYRVRYDRINSEVLSPSDTWIEMDYHPYNAYGNAEKFLKITAAHKISWSYNNKKNIVARFWGSAFLLNTQRNTKSYSNSLVKGSIALIQQGYNDYAYDDYFLNRQNQMGFARNQISEKGGGFKTAPTSAYQVGLSNNWASAINLYADLPINAPILKPLQFYFDAGVYSQGQESKLLYSGGICLNLMDGLFKAYLPLFNHQDISNIYLSEEKSLFSRVSFSIDFSRSNPWQIIDDYNY